MADAWMDKSVYELCCVWDSSTHIYLHPLLNPVQENELFPLLSLNAQGWNVFLFHLLWRSIFPNTHKIPLINFLFSFLRLSLPWPGFWGCSCRCLETSLPLLGLQVRNLLPKETLVPSTYSLIWSLWHKSEFTPVLGCCECSPQKRKTLPFLDESKPKQNKKNPGSTLFMTSHLSALLLL